MANKGIKIKQPPFNAIVMVDNKHGGSEDKFIDDDIETWHNFNVGDVVTAYRVSDDEVRAIDINGLEQWLPIQYLWIVE